MFKNMAGEQVDFFNWQGEEKKSTNCAFLYTKTGETLYFFSRKSKYAIQLTVIKSPFGDFLYFSWRPFNLQPLNFDKN